jgi:hypothetical protein
MREPWRRQAAKSLLRAPEALIDELAFPTEGTPLSELAQRLIAHSRPDILESVLAFRRQLIAATEADTIN